MEDQKRCSSCLRLKSYIHFKYLKTKDEYSSVVFDWNKTERSYPHTRTLHALFEAQVRKTPQHIALVYEEQTLSYQALDEEANLLARFIQKYYSKRQLVLGSDTLIALCVSRSFDMVIGILAILKAGAAYVPMDASAPIERLHYMLEDAGSLLLLTERRLIDTQFFTAGLPLELIFLDEKPYQHESCSPLSMCGQSTDLAYVIYTSGTTGKPKGVMIEHKSAINLAYAQYNIFHLSQKSILVNYFSIAFDASVSEIFCALIFGCTLHIIREEIVRSPLDIVCYLAENKISAITLPPALLSMIDWSKLPSLQTIGFGQQFEISLHTVVFHLQFDIFVDIVYIYQILSSLPLLYSRALLSHRSINRC